MLFNSVQFIIFFPIVVMILFLVPQKLRIYWLLVASYYFYMCWNAKYALLIAFSTLITWVTGILLEKSECKWKRKLCIGICCLANFGVLFVFKYLNFAIENINHLMDVINSGGHIKALDLLLPVGISFYTFQAVGYIIDVYRKDIKAEHNLCRYALFISFFPQLVAGPIERAGNMLDQLKELEKKQLLQYRQVKNGFLMMAWGMFQKVIVSDRLAIIVDEIYGNYSEYGLTTIIFGTVMFAFQIYCDFDGYTNIACGAAEVMGIRLMKNFKQPYLATNIREFWRRWHISLTSWFRDYLYIPLGGNRKGTVRKYINTIVVFLVSGLWHGVGWNFLLWGAIHGVAQVCSGMRRKDEKLNFSAKLRRGIFTFAVVDFAWLFFRADSVGHALALLKQMTTQIGDFSMIGGCLDFGNWMILLLGLLAVFLVDVVHERGIRIREWLEKQEIWFRYAVYLFLFCSCLYMGVNYADGGVTQFIYFQF